jgi:hypothetical protein
MRKELPDSLKRYYWRLRYFGLLRNSESRILRLLWKSLHYIWRKYLFLKSTIVRNIYFLQQRFVREAGQDILSCKVGVDKASWEKAFILLWEPLYGRFSKGKALVKVTGPQLGSPGCRGSRYEGFARSFIGASYYLHNKDNGLVALNDGAEIDLAALYGEGIANGTDPGHKEYWGKIVSPVRLVENCSLAIGLLLTKDLIWNKLEDRVKANVVHWFEIQSNEIFPHNNWLWFKVFHHLFLEQAGSQNHRDVIIRSLEIIEEMYNGDGWYSDGLPPNTVYDYYSCWAMQFYPLLFSLLAGNDYSDWIDKFISYARKFFNDYIYFFSENSQPPLYGRSQIYRWASISPWGLAIKLSATDIDLQQIKALLIKTVNTFLERGAVKRDGFLSCGYFHEYYPMMEGYSSPGSPYWAFKGFSLLLLPDDHPFWGASPGNKQPAEAVHTIPGAGMCLSNDGKSHVIIYPNVTTTRFINEIRYNKCAYSNIFLMNYDNNFPIDNYLLLHQGKGRFLRRKDASILSCCNGICETLWRFDSTLDIEILTTIIAVPDGYTVRHRFRGEAKVDYCIGGFAIILDTNYIEIFSRGDVLSLRHCDYEVGIEILYGEGYQDTYMKKGVNPGGKYSCVPYFRGCLKDCDEIGFRIWGLHRTL